MDAKDRQYRLAYVYALAAVVFWGTAASAFKISLQFVDGMTLLLVASATSAAAFFLYLVATQRLGLLRTYTRRDWLWSAGLGLLNPFLYYLVIFKAYSLLLAQEAQPINFVWPLTLVLLSIPLLGQRIKLASILAILVSFSGVVVIATHPERPADILAFRFSNGLGVALALGSTVVWALYWVLNTKDRRDEAARLFVNFLFACVYIVVLTVLIGKLGVPPWQGLLGGVYIGLFEMGITFLLWLKALRSAKTTAHVVNLIYLVPFLSLLVIAMVVGEEIRASTLVGLVLIITGIVLQKIWG
ncbi:MAG: DMT family transporter [Phycisphaerae bacterium]|nr:DMT family transporter [Phycisphaerae bacterium]